MAAESAPLPQQPWHEHRVQVHAAWLVSMQSVAWTATAGPAAIAVGLLSSSSVLVALGAIGFVDGLGSAALAYHFRHAVRHEALSDRLERLAHLVVLVGLLVVGLGAVAGGAFRLAGGQRSESSAVGIGLAVVSLTVLSVLSKRKRAIAALVRSPALRSDGHLSAVGATQAAITTVGSITTAVGWRWADPAAAIVVGCVAVGVSFQTWIAGGE